MCDYMCVRLINKHSVVIEVRIVVGLLVGEGHKGTFLGDRDTLRLVRVLVTWAYVQCKYPYRLVDI